MAKLAKAVGLDSPGDIVGNAELLVAGSLSAVASWDSGVFTAHDIIIIRLRVRGSAGGSMTFQLNNDGNANYYYQTTKQAVVAVTTAATSIHLAQFPAADYQVVATLIIGGTRADSEAQTGIGASVGCAGFSVNGSLLIGGSYLSFPAGGITRIKFDVGAGNLTGDIKVYGYDF